MQKKIECPRSKCSNRAQIHPRFGILPCEACNSKDNGVRLRRKYQFANISQLHRVQKMRDDHGKDLLQPYEGDGVNKDFFEAFPDKVEDYNTLEELKKL